MDPVYDDPKFWISVLGDTTRRSMHRPEITLYKSDHHGFAVLAELRIAATFVSSDPEMIRRFFSPSSLNSICATNVPSCRPTKRPRIAQGPRTRRDRSEGAPLAFQRRGFGNNYSCEYIRTAADDSVWHHWRGENNIERAQLLDDQETRIALRKNVTCDGNWS